MAIRDEFKSPKTKTYAKDNKGNVKPVKKKTFKQKWIPEKNDSIGEIFWKVISIIALIVLVGCLGVLAYHFVKAGEADKSYQDIQDEYDQHINNNDNHNNSGNTTVPDSDDNSPRPIMPGAQALLDKNPDTVGWIQVPGTKIKYPVVMRKGATNAQEGNGFYLNHMFDGSYNRAGAVYADYRTTIEDRKQSDNIVLYAHNEKDNTMFGDLDLYKKANNGYTTQADMDFFRSAPIFNFNTNYEMGQYKIFGMFVTTTMKSTDPSYPIFDYQNYIDFDRARFDDFIKKINERNMIKTDVDVKFGDKFVTLSTCSNEITDSRFVVVGRKVRPGEALGFGADINTSFIEPNWNAIFKNYRETMTETTPADTSLPEVPDITDIIPDYSEQTDVTVDTDNTDNFESEENIPVVTTTNPPPQTDTTTVTVPSQTEPVITEPPVTDVTTTETTPEFIFSEEDEGPLFENETLPSEEDDDIIIEEDIA